MIDNKKKVLIIGNFGYKNHLNSQTKKITTISHYLASRKLKICTVNTNYENKYVFVLNFMKMLLFVLFYKKIILSINQNGLLFGKHIILRILKKKQVYYVTIGGWLPNFIDYHMELKKYFQSFKMIYVQSNEIMKKLIINEIFNVYNIKNFREINDSERLLIEENIKKYNRLNKNHYKFIFFASIRKGKGLEEAIDSVIKINKSQKSIKISLDIFGLIRNNYKEQFSILMDKIKDISFINYYGALKSQHDIYMTLHKYDALLFPTYYHGEGFPTVIAESFLSGLPVLATDWKYNSEIITEGKNGYLYKANDIDDMIRAIMKFIQETDIKKMKTQILSSSNEFTSENALTKIYTDLF